MVRIETASKLSLRRVSKQYGGLEVLAPLDLEVAKGEFVTLLGPSGSGKSTLLRIIAGMTLPSGGQVFIDGNDATDIPARARGLGMVFQNYALVPHMTVFENVAFPLRVRKVPKAEITQRVAAVLEMVQLSSLSQRLPAQLSGGQQQRVAIARSLIYDPSLILMDEPLGALDKKLREQLQSEISALHRRLGITIIYVTHDQHEAMSMSDRIVLMNNGKVEQVAAPEGVYYRPDSIFAAEFLGESNLFDAEVTATGDRPRLRLVGGPDVIGPELSSSMKVGDMIRLFIRPEHLSLDAASNDENAVTALPVKSTFLGANTRFHLLLGETQLLIVNSSTESARSFLASGQTVRVSWRPEHSIAFAS
jgi:putative spermidine/putrescine transport system ATP-binding protein